MSELQDAFTKIYRCNIWGRAPNASQPFFSGIGSHKSSVVDTYVRSVRHFLRIFRYKPDVIDLGCGDFVVGYRIRDLCARYIACDIVEPLIEWNKQLYRDANVDFRIVDITATEPPKAKIAFVRQVLQHLSNELILEFIAKIEGSYEYLVVSEHIPSSANFYPNRDKPTGPTIRHDLNSGVVLTSPPFNLKVAKTILLCDASIGTGIIRTNIYRF